MYLLRIDNVPPLTATTSEIMSIMAFINGEVFCWSVF